MGRTKNKERYHFRFDKEVIEAVDRLAEMKCTTRSQLVRDSVYHFLIKDYRNELKQSDEYKRTMQSIKKIRNSGRIENVDRINNDIREEYHDGTRGFF